jgi:predicted transcriptional regulator
MRTFKDIRESAKGMVGGFSVEIPKQTISGKTIGGGKNGIFVKAKTARQAISMAAKRLGVDFKMLKVGKVIKEGVESLDEASNNASLISRYTGTRVDAVDDFINTHKLDSEKLLTFVGDKGSLKNRMTFTAAISGKANNRMSRKIVKDFAESVSESVELDEAYQQFLDKTPNWGEDKAISYGRKKGYKEIGVVGYGKIDGIVLFGLDAGDKSYVGKEAKVKTGQTVFRYATSRTVAGDIFPLVKIDVKKGLLYHLSQKSSEGEIEHAEFETKSSKLRYLRLLSTANLRDITGFDPGFGSMKESVDLEEGKMKEFHAMVKKGMTAAQIAKKIGMKEKDVAEFMKGMNEAKEYSYTVVHAKKGKVVVTAPTSYDAAQKAAKQWKLKSTSGVDAHLMKESTDLDLARLKLLLGR